MLSWHTNELFKYLINKSPTTSPFKNFLFKIYLISYLIIELIIGSNFAVKILSPIRNIKLITKTRYNLIILHKIEHIPYLYDMLSNSKYKNWKGTIIDIGAHIGTFSLIFSTKSIVYSFEPEKINFNFLKTNINKNNLNKNIFPINLAVSNKKGKKRFYFSEGSGGHSFYLKNKSHFEEVDTTSLDKFFKRIKLFSPILIKIDAEGEEYNILQGAKKIIKRFHPDFIIELHPWYIDTSNVIELLRNNHYQIKQLKTFTIFASYKK